MFKNTYFEEHLRATVSVQATSNKETQENKKNKQIKPSKTTPKTKHKKQKN